MGLDDASVKFLCAAKSLGVNFTSTATIGRQQLYLNAATLRRVFSVLGISQCADDFLRENTYGDQFFSLLGAEHVESLDYSTYEGATLIHDMNLPISAELRERFSVVHDGGSIEHVFNAPQAFKNCMEMVQIGGHFTQVNAANNFMGHGFWQFSPELIFRMFSRENGFRIEVVLLHEATHGGAWYIVSDPEDVRSRVELCNDRPTYILTVAKRIERTNIFTNIPMQSDYVASWNGAVNGNTKSTSTWIRTNIRASCSDRSAWWRCVVPSPVMRLIRRACKRGFRREKSGFNSPYFHRVDEYALLRGRLV
jgi:hypothetical protein